MTFRVSQDRSRKVRAPVQAPHSRGGFKPFVHAESGRRFLCIPRSAHGATQYNNIHQ